MIFKGIHNTKAFKVNIKNFYLLDFYLKLKITINGLNIAILYIFHKRCTVELCVHVFSKYSQKSDLNPIVDIQQISFNQFQLWGKNLVKSIRQIYLSI